MNRTERAIAQWLAGRDTGLSSETIAFAHLGVWCSRPTMPADPADFGRCARLIRAVPAIRRSWRKRYLAMYPEFQPLVTHWQAIHRTMEREVGIDWSKGKRASETYDLMKGLGF